MSDLNKELKRAEDFAKLCGREVGNREHLFLQSQLLVQEGITELSEALYKNDRTMLRDALADTLVVAMGGVYISGEVNRTFSPTGWGEVLDIGVMVSQCVFSVLEEVYDNTVSARRCYSELINKIYSFSLVSEIDLVTDLKAVNDSNLSKFCLTVEEAQQTVEKYAAIGVNAEYKMTWNEDYPYAVYSTETNGDFTKGKLLKSVNYAEPVFS